MLIPGLLGLAVPFFQVVTAVHAYKTGRGEWIWLIVFFPGVGAAVYFFVEMLPDIRHGSLRETAGEILDSLIPGRELRRLEESLEIADTVANRQALARYHVKRGRPEAAVPLLEACREGHWKNEPEILMGLAEAHLEAGSYAKAESVLGELSAVEPRLSPARDLLAARAAERLGRPGDARPLYERAAQEAVGGEAAYRLGAFLARTGDSAGARAVFRELLTRSRRAGKLFNRTEAEWVRRTQKALASLKTA